MSAFRRQTKLVEETEEALRALEGEYGEPSELKGDRTRLVEGMEKLKSLGGSVTTAVEDMAGFVERANEKDPDKKIYGPGMVKRVLALDAKAAAIKEEYEALFARWEEAYIPILREKERAVAAERAEAERQRAAEAEAEKIRKETEERIRKAEERGREQEARLKEEQKRQAEREAELRLRAEREKYAEQKLQLQKEAERRARAEKMSPAEALSIIKSKNGYYQAQRALMTLRTLLGNIVNDPGVKTYRRVRQKNKHIQSELLQYAGGEDFLLSIGFRMKRIKADLEPNPKKELKQKILQFYKTFAPHELPKVDVERVVDFFAGGKEAELWDRLRKKYGKSEEDLPEQFDEDRNGELFYVLDEPFTGNRGEWQEWFNTLKAAKSLLSS
mmetsp:Transcript_19087/g.46849  ORF Transcript_19087/g.46849 Transcript_19087/m.46849 type:complete len:387 (-) Transcript_19087:207-1367(-)|eukprot:CAMPEP_0114494384 /NCGR_PEP_ID=MMETSP0109-20121206/4623_1 /TAXON_ID=29199 /ORGANISM="Chlorarachnion reptans, Strain CCCM449" /LENGTH=386 /DNA_ID=CAMNT_0001671417 /DNA_START=119 /DNA_END=1279 /DNA_ORIENTATION=-